MSELPAGWTRVQLGEVAAVNPRFRATVSDETDVSFIPMAAVEAESGRIDSSETSAFGVLRQKSYRHFCEGDVLVAKITPSMENGKAAVARGLMNGAGFGSTEFHVLRPSPAVDADYLLHFVLQRSFRADAARRMTGTAGQLRVPPDYLRHVALPLPPLDEQHRIVEAIEEQFSRLDAGVASLQRAKRNIARMRASVRQAAVEGRLTSGANSCGTSEWIPVAIGEIGHVGSGATPKRGEARYWQGGTIPWVTSGQLNDPFVTEPAALITRAALHETSVRVWPRNTLLVAMYGEGKTRGRCSELLIEATTNQACAAIVLRPQFEYARPFVKLYLAASYESNRRLASGGVQPNLSLGRVKALRFQIPPPSAMAALIEEVDRQLSILGAMEATVDAALARADGLRQAILRAAFAGRLAAQDPNDEPASALLERISSERTTA